MFEPGADAFAAATRVPAWTRPSERRFSAVSDGVGAGGFSAWADPEAAPAPAPVQPTMEIETLLAEAHAAGVAEGRAQMEAAFTEEVTALHTLAASLENLRPEPPQALGMLLAATVRRLVTQVVGEVEIGHDALDARAAAVAAVIADETGPSRLRLHPADMALLGDATQGLALTPDPTLARGTILVETGSGWVEDGPAVRMEKIHAALDRMGLAR